MIDRHASRTAVAEMVMPGPYPPIKVSSRTLKRAAKLRKEIDALREKLARLLCPPTTSG